MGPYTLVQGVGCVWGALLPFSRKISMWGKLEPVTSGCLSPAHLGTDTRAKSMYRGLANIALESFLFCPTTLTGAGSQQTLNRAITRSVTKSTEGEKRGNGTGKAGFRKRESRRQSCWRRRPWSIWGPSWRNGTQRGTGTRAKEAGESLLLGRW